MEGIKETEFTRIEKDNDSLSEIEMLYSFNVVIFEHTILKNERYEYSICFFAPENIYDVVIIDKLNHTLLKYESTSTLNDKLSDYFNLINGESTIDCDGNKLICRSHSIEYTL